jgi:hypothetical protein
LIEHLRRHLWDFANEFAIGTRLLVGGSLGLLVLLDILLATTVPLADDTLDLEINC